METNYSAISQVWWDDGRQRSGFPHTSLYKLLLRHFEQLEATSHSGSYKWWQEVIKRKIWTLRPENPLEQHQYNAHSKVYVYQQGWALMWWIERRNPTDLTAVRKASSGQSQRFYWALFDFWGLSSEGWDTPLYSVIKKKKNISTLKEKKK